MKCLTILRKVWILDLQIFRLAVLPNHQNGPQNSSSTTSKLTAEKILVKYGLLIAGSGKCRDGGKERGKGVGQVSWWHSWWVGPS